MRAGKILASLLFSALFVLSAALPCFGESSALVGDIADEINGTFRFLYEKDGAENIQEWIDESLSGNIGASEWSVISLAKYGHSCDFSSYTKAVSAALEENSVKNPVTELKCAFALLSAESENISEYDGLFSAVIDRDTGAKGIMSYVFALHLLNNGCTDESYTAADVISEILGLRNGDGGWSVSGSVSDTDVTAMVLQALAPSYNTDEKVKQASDEALDLLSGKQLESGGFSSYGTENAESSAQVVIALCSLGIDPAGDKRFIKNSRSPLDALREFRLEDGSYSHASGGESNRTASEQALCALVSYAGFLSGESGFYTVSRSDDSDQPQGDADDTHRVTQDVSVSSYENDTSGASDKDPDGAAGIGDDNTASGNGTSGGIGIKSIIIIVLCLAAVGVFVVLIVSKKANKGNLIITAAVFAILITAAVLSDISSPEQYYSADDVGGAGYVTFSVSCDRIAGLKGVPADTLIVPECEVDFGEGDTVYDILISCAKKYQLVLDMNGANEESAYISGINGIYEAQYGDLSGWVYLVNGEIPSVGCGSYTVHDGDRIQWVYTLELGNDVKD